MADEENIKEAGSSEPIVGYTEDPNIPRRYVSNGLINLTPTDVYLYFGEGLTIKVDGQPRIKYDSCTIMSHAMFMSFMEPWIAHYEFLKAAYEGIPMGLDQIQARDPERYLRAATKVPQSKSDESSGGDNE